MSIESRSKGYGIHFGEWQTESLLGSGSNGKSAVFLLSRDNGWREVCALKVINLIEEKGRLEHFPEYRRQEYKNAVRRVKADASREVQLMNQLRGKTNVVDYLDHRFETWEEENSFGVDLLIRMEKLQDLRGEMLRGRIFRESEIITLGRGICQALVHTHSKQIIHRDIKPENIFFNQDGDYKLGDFGIARIMSGCPVSQASTSIGTAAYAAPEQSTGSYDHRVDIYSIGLVLYELLNENRLPFAHSGYVTERQIQLRLSGTPLPMPISHSHVKPEALPTKSTLLTRIIMKATAFHPQDRYASAEEMLFDLDRAAEESAWTAEQPSAVTAKRPDTKSRQRMIPLISLAAIILCLLCFSLFRHRHSWSEATCMLPQSCSVCGEVRGEPLEHRWKEATCTSPKTCPVCGAVSGDPLEHQWLEADCINPRICSVCGEKNGEPLAHTWISAACGTPEACSACGITRNEALGHDWQEASCTLPMICRRCGASDGYPLGHSWLPATQYSSKTCDRCLATEGGALSDTPLDLGQEIKRISDYFQEISTALKESAYEKEQLENRVFAYHFDDPSLFYVSVARGASGIGSESENYSRWYYFKDGKLFFALFEGADSHRLYFHNGELIRWRYCAEAARNDQYTNFDLLNNSQFRYWENLALTEAARFQPE